MVVLNIIRNSIFGFLPLISINFDNHFIKNKTVITAIGIAVTLGLMFFDYIKLKRYRWLYYTFGLTILVLLLLFPNATVNGVPYFVIGPLTITSVISLPFFYLSLASFLEGERISFWLIGILFIMPIPFFFFVNFIPTIIIYITMVLVMIYWSSIGNINKLLFTFTTFTFTGILFWFNSSIYIKEVIFSQENRNGVEYLFQLSKKLLLDAGWLGHSDNMKIIPSAHTDLVFVNLTYHFGWLLSLFLVVVLLILTMRMIFIIHKIIDPFGKMLIVGGVALFTVQFVFNIGMILGYFPMISISLPFISYGLMPTLLNSIIIGIVLCVYRRKDLISKFNL
ncbi:FtsW/RodA/SpoVE family cell cycle protein [Virgibacillus necropolis]|uniref:FtsW/RodA/SpoVE family cell cycle protein n=1 Tax=Virgibacillus necropolis TaxID=163877 RepID=UPI0038511C40